MESGRGQGAADRVRSDFMNLRWKWIIYHVYSNLLTAAIVLAVTLAMISSLAGVKITYNMIISLSSLAMLASVLLGVICGFNFSRNLRHRLEEVSAGAKNLAYGNLKYRLNFTEDKEMGDIATAFNEMARRLEQQVVALQTLAEENEKLIQQTKSAAISEERQRLARELHDAVSQQLFAISMTAATATRVISKNPQKCESLISDIEESASRAQAEMRALLLQLRPITLESESLVEAISSLAQELQSKQALQCELDLADLSLSHNMENQLYRVIQEGLSNILRHAKASKVIIRLSSSEEKQRIRLSIEDDGQGFSPDQISKTSYGLKTIRERIEQLGGTVNWLSYPGQGTRLEVLIPITK